MFSKLHTSCRDCIFATYDEQNKTQKGCELNKIEKLINSGVKVVESFDEEKEFYVLDNHACMTYRKKLLPNKTIEEQAEIAKKQATPRIDCVITVESDDILDLEKTIKSLINQENQFHEVVFCILSKIKPSQIVSLINTNEGKFKWSIKQIIDEYWTGSKAINVAVQKSRSTYASVFNSGFEIPKTFVKEMCHSLTEDMKRFIMLNSVDEKSNGLTVQIYAFNALRGNEEAYTDEENAKPVNSFIEKISYIAANQNLTNLIKNCEEICPCIKKQ